MSDAAAAIRIPVSELAFGHTLVDEAGSHWLVTRTTVLPDGYSSMINFNYSPNGDRYLWDDVVTVITDGWPLASDR